VTIEVVCATDRFAARVDTTARWTLSGDLDMAAAPVFSHFAHRAPFPFDGLSLWVHEVTFADTAGWRALHELHRDIGLQRSLRLVGASGPIVLVFECFGAP
jgi:hypothetical protein